MSAVPRIIPADALPVNLSDKRAPVWWGVLMLILIELTVFAALVASYFYLKFHAPVWPPDGIEPPDLLLPSINAGILLVSSLPVWWADRSIRKGDTRALKLGLAIGFVLGATFLVLKVIEYAGNDYTWATNAYGSIVWTITGFHSAHVLILLIKTLVVLVLAFRGYFSERRNVGVQANGLYWHFVVVVWIPLFATLYLSPRFL
ncbi:MAG TPA: cytochrome c oxidase subunit 3 [Chloroflexaceae bacterium]|nr:cytochrome c oxidase subunit 3 [Chloroflexaceae bacterium]